jgi:ubiquinone/menaquinone biosynthesis C-methylase UbiE
MESQSAKNRIVQFWNKKPCGTLGKIPERPDLKYFNQIKGRRYKLEPFIRSIVQFEKWQGKKILEIGCGIGIDGMEFTKNGADYTGIDISEKSLWLAKNYFSLNQQKSNLLLADAENLPFEDNSFDLVYSWGVLHHTPDIRQAIKEIYRALKPNGTLIIMLYNKYSLVGLQLYIRYGFLKGNIGANLNDLYAFHHESPGTKAFTDKEVKDLFSRFRELKISNIVTPYDLRIARNIFLPKIFQLVIPSKLGFFKIIQAKK